MIGETHTPRWQLLAAYTSSRTRGSVNNGNGENRASGADTGQAALGVFFNPNRSINAEALSSGDSPHQLNIQGTYLMPVWGGIRLSGQCRYFGGLAWGRVATITGLAQGNQVVRIEPRGTERLESVAQMDLSLEKTFPLGGRRSAGIYADAFNSR